MKVGLSSNCSGALVWMSAGFKVTHSLFIPPLQLKVITLIQSKMAQMIRGGAAAGGGKVYCSRQL